MGHYSSQHVYRISFAFDKKRKAGSINGRNGYGMHGFPINPIRIKKVYRYKSFFHHLKQQHGACHKNIEH
jgi:hypothetical protein